MYYKGNEISVTRSWEIRKLLEQIYNLHITISPQLCMFQIYRKADVGFNYVYARTCHHNTPTEKLQLLAIDYCAQHILNYDILSEGINTDNSQD